MKPDFIHRYIPPENVEEDRTLLLLHGTGGTEEDMIPLGRRLLPGAGILSPRGKVLEDGAARYFRRLAEGVFDIEDLRFRANELADFIEVAAGQYEFETSMVIAVGYSNGANMAAALMFLRPKVLTGAVLFRPIVPFVPDTLPDLRGKNVLIASGRHDRTAPADASDHLGGLLQQCGAGIRIHVEEAGHEITDGDAEAAREWLESLD